MKMMNKAIVGAAIVGASLTGVKAQDLRFYNAKTDTLKDKCTTNVVIAPTLKADMDGTTRNFSEFTLRQTLPLGSRITLMAEGQTLLEANKDAKAISGVADKPGRVRAQGLLEVGADLLRNPEGSLRTVLGGYVANNPDLEVTGYAQPNSFGGYAQIVGEQNGVCTKLEGGVEKAGAGRAVMIDAVAGMAYRDSIDAGVFKGTGLIGFDYVFSRETMRQSFGFYMPYSSTMEVVAKLSLNLGNKTDLVFGAQAGKYFQSFEAGVQLSSGMKVVGMYQSGYDDRLNNNYTRGAVGITYRY